jgi:hypothetical protein
LNPPARRYLPLLLVLFAGGGCSALIYEIVWYQLLQLVIGSSAVSLGVLLATFMGGLCLGSLALPRLGLAGQHPMRVYGKLDSGDPAARPGLRLVPAASHLFDGRISAGGCARPNRRPRCQRQRSVPRWGARRTLPARRLKRSP